MLHGKRLSQTPLKVLACKQPPEYTGLFTSASQAERSSVIVGILQRRNGGTHAWLEVPASFAATGCAPRLQIWDFPGEFFNACLTCRTLRAPMSCETSRSPSSCSTSVWASLEIVCQRQPGYARAFLRIFGCLSADIWHP